MQTNTIDMQIKILMDHISDNDKSIITTLDKSVLGSGFATTVLLCSHVKLKSEEKLP